MSIARVELSIVLLLLLPLSIVTCAEQPVVKTSHDDAAAAAPAKTVEQDAPASTGETCGDVACQSNSDCCKGYSCGFDPERSRIQRYCLGP